MNNPSMIAFDTPRHTSMSSNLSTDMAAMSAQSGTVLQITDGTKVTPTPSHITPRIKFACSSCTFASESQEILENHVKEEHMFTCDVCKETFDSKKEKEAHTLKEHATKAYNCTKCEKLFTNSKELQTHTEKDHGITAMSQCVMCEISFVTKEELDKHVKTKHVTNCPLCTNSYTTMEELLNHIKNEHAPRCTNCNESFQTKDDLVNHIEMHHANRTNFKCGICKKSFVTEENLNQHLENEHARHINADPNHICKVCDANFETNALLESHTKEDHTFSCPICNNVYNEVSQLKEHVRNTHTYECNTCDFVGTSEDIMENHVLEEHFSPDENGQYQCNECNFNCKTKEELRDHMRKDLHQNTTIDGDQTEEHEKLKEDLRLLKSNFKRLESMFKESDQELKKVKIEYEAKLNEANEKYRAAKAENEELKEKVDVLFKLGRSYINRSEKSKEEEAIQNHENNIETVTIDQDDRNESLEELQTWTRQKHRGFRRSNPSTSPTKNQNIELTSKRSPTTARLLTSSAETSTTSPAPPSSPDPTPPAPPQQPSRAPGREPRTLYCHYFSNYGRCLYEEKTGNKCKFEHGAAPVCQSGASCSRSKCMYKHPNLAGRKITNSQSPFLYQENRPFLHNQTPHNYHPMQMMNPWLLPMPNHPMNQWNVNPLRN